jgi:two-component system, chemotaxis family, chemotaxis protein CheY
MCPPPIVDMALRHILVVDDEKHVAQTFQAGLEKLPCCQVEVATSGEQALSLLQEQPYHLVITDYKMPGMSGLVLAELIRQQWPALPILMITAYASDLPRDAVHGDQIARILNKPLTLVEMRRVAEELLPHGS